VQNEHIGRAGSDDGLVAASFGPGVGRRCWPSQVRTWRRYTALESELAFT
jgi:hypothetical protein